jgi:hypothetical protein
LVAHFKKEISALMEGDIDEGFSNLFNCRKYLFKIDVKELQG